MEDSVFKVQEWIALNGIRVLLQLVTAVLIFVIGRWVAQLIRKLVTKLMESGNLDKTLIGFVASLSYIAMMTFVIIAAIGKLGFQTNSFIAVLGAAGLAVGFALQGSLSNFAAGVLMIIFKPFKVGDFVEAAGVTGVSELGESSVNFVVRPWVNTA
ncbi:MAG: mechanosensitive ion channel, partial [Verrucomicrobia bacterium]|nr:mechanosensitive ion channel [Verrucomicrobiota bacterium]